LGSAVCRSLVEGEEQRGDRSRSFCAWGDTLHVSSCIPRLLPLPMCSRETWPPGSLTGSGECSSGADPDKPRRGHPEDAPLASADCSRNHNSQGGRLGLERWQRRPFGFSACLLPRSNRVDNPVRGRGLSVRHTATYQRRSRRELEHLREWRSRRLSGGWFRSRA
jgi:hypothetical protein